MGKRLGQGNLIIRTRRVEEYLHDIGSPWCAALDTSLIVSIWRHSTIGSRSRNITESALISQHSHPLRSTLFLVVLLARHKMSTAHRPTWDPAQAREVKGGSRQYSVRDMAAHTKLKFRCAWL